MKICIIGKYPPIQGGVSTRTYRYAHGLAARGHQVHVITNASEATPPFRVFMRDEDWARCEAAYNPGSVTAHWTDPVDRRQFHIPMASPFVSKLSSLAVSVARDTGADAIFSYYAEPYAIAGHLAAEICGLPHVVRTAGSDAGRLWDHPQFAPLYDHIFRSADFVLAGGRVAKKMIEAGVDPARIFLDGDYVVPEEVFRPDGAALDLDVLSREVAATPDFAPLLWGEAPSDMPFIGVYGKLGPKKGTLPLLRALAKLKSSGTDIGLLLMAHPRPRAPHDYRREVETLGLTGNVLQIPFLPNWRVPEFIRRCLAVCCLEQDFPIQFHTPIIAREVLACGGCLVGSTEILGKLPDAKRLVDGYNCAAVPDVEDVDALADIIGAIVGDPAPTADVGARGRRYVQEIQHGRNFPEQFEQVLSILVGQGTEGTTPAPAGAEPGQSLTDLALGSLPVAQRDAVKAGDISDPSVAAAADAIRFDAIQARAGETQARPDGDEPDLLRRLTSSGWALSEGSIASAVPALLGPIHVEHFDHDVAAFLDAERSGVFPAEPPRRPTVVVERVGSAHVGPFVLEPAEARVLDLCDGTRPIDDICRAAATEQGSEGQTRETIERMVVHLFEIGLLRLSA